MKILIVICNHGKGQIEHLSKTIKEWQSFSKKYEIKIIIHSSIDIQYEGVEVRKVTDLKDWWLLPLSTRRTIYDYRNADFDLFVFTENDILITEKHIESFLEVTEILPFYYVAGFLRYEAKGLLKYYPDYHDKFKWDKKSVIKLGHYTFAQFTNHHQGSYIFTKQQLDHIIDNFPTSFTANNKFSYYGRPERVGADLYHLGGLTKLICISHFDNFLLHHMPNKYVDNYILNPEAIHSKDISTFDDTMQRDIDHLLNHSKKSSHAIHRIRFKLINSYNRIKYTPNLFSMVRHIIRGNWKVFKMDSTA